MAHCQNHWSKLKSITLHHFTSHSISKLHTYIHDSCFGPISVFHIHFSVLSPFQRFIPILAFYPQFSVLSSFQCFIPISVFYPHFSVVSPFQCFIPISALYPHFSVLSPFQCFIPISAFYPHFSFRFQFPFQPFSFSVLSRPLARPDHQIVKKILKIFFSENHCQ